MENFVTIVNDGKDIAETNYFESDHAAQGYYFGSTNAGCLRLLIPDNRVNDIEKIKTAKHVILSRGPWMDVGQPDGIELLFEDLSDTPYFVQMVPQQFDMIPDGQGEWILTVWTPGGKQFECPLRCRKVNSIPCLREWGAD